MTDRNISKLPDIYRAGNDAVTAAYQHGLEEGRRLGYEEQARDHHNWLLTHDERLAEVARQARRAALSDAADAWESTDADGLRKMAEEHYVPGGPSMPSIWLNLRAQAEDIATEVTR